MTIACVICDCELVIGEGIVVNEIISCDECGSELEIISLDPLTLQEAPEIEEDWGE